MGKGIFWIAAIGAPVAAFYFWDGKKGKKRRTQLRKGVERCMHQTEDLVKHYSKEYSPVVGGYLRDAGRKANELSREYGTRVKGYAADTTSKAGELAKNGHTGWAPSARTLGAVGSALAFYGAGRPGLLGTALRIASLGVFTRALMTSR